MIFRPIGKTGMKASIIGLGMEHLDHRPYETCEEVIDALEHKASECIACGSCESRCPFGVRIIDNMSRAAALFE